jgi:hypothetical protein
MSLPQQQWYRLVPRGEAGLVCDKDGVALGGVALAAAHTDARRMRRCEVRPADELGHVLSAAYGPQPDAIVLRFHRGLSRAAASIETGDLCRAGIEAVLLGFPDLTPRAMAKLDEFADLEKGGAWENEPRIPAGQAGGGQWTTGGAFGNGAAVDGRPDRRASPLDDGVYRPGVDRPLLTPVGGAEEDEEPRRGSNGAPEEFNTLEDVFPGLNNHPVVATMLAPVDGFLGISASADAANLDATLAQYRMLIAQIKAVNPGFADEELLPPGGIAGLTWQGRGRLIDGLRMQRAVAYYKILGNFDLLQVETLRFLQDAVDKAYEGAKQEYDAGDLKPHLSREEAIGNYIDPIVRQGLRQLFNNYQIRYGPRTDITINNRDYDTSEADSSYTVPDARIGKVSFDWTLTLKTIAGRQIRGFFRADSQPWAVVIVRPSRLGQDSMYLIPRPSTLSPRE